MDDFTYDDETSDQPESKYDHADAPEQLRDLLENMLDVPVSIHRGRMSRQDARERREMIHYVTTLIQQSMMEDALMMMNINIEGYLRPLYEMIDGLMRYRYGPDMANLINEFIFGHKNSDEPRLFNLGEGRIVNIPNPETLYHVYRTYFKEGGTTKGS